MNTIGLSRKILLVGAVGVVLASILIGKALFAQAEVGPSVTAVVHNTSHATTTSAAIGSLVHVNVLVGTSTGTTTPTGSVNISTYLNTSCSGTALVQSDVALVNGIAESAATTTPASGLSFKVHYNGEGLEVPADSLCMPLNATASNTSISTTLSTTSMLAGSSVFDSATLSNKTDSASGTVAYAFYTNNTCTTGAVSAGLKPVTNGSVPNSDTLIILNAGTYWWQAVYSGDGNNNPATSTCTSEVLTVNATSTPAPITGHLIVDKVTNVASSTSFHFNTTGTGYSSFDLTATQTPNDQTLAPGTYSVSESSIPGWNLSSVACSRNGAASTAYTPGTSITLNSNDTITCTFTNTAVVSGTTTPPTPPENCEKEKLVQFDKGFPFHGGFSLHLDSLMKKIDCDHDNGKHLGQIKEHKNNGKHLGQDKDKNKDDDKSCNKDDNDNEDNDD